MSNKLQELRKKLQEKENNQNNFSGDNALYPFWNIPFSTETEIIPAVIRFLPDGDEENDYFWVEVQKIKLTFPGIKGQDEEKEVFVQVPCMETWGKNETCPILTETRPWFKGDKETERLARKYWKKYTYIFQGFVRENPLNETDAPENPIRRFSITSKLFKKIRSGLMDIDMEEMPDDYVAGNDFKIIKTQISTENGTFPNYDTSQYAKLPNSLTTDEVEAIEEHGLKNLSDFIPKKPDDETIVIIKNMFDASVNGELYDSELWSNYYRPAGLNKNRTDDDNKTTTSKLASESTTKKETSVTPPVETISETLIEDTPSTSEDVRPPRDILADIKKRAEEQKQKQQQD